MKFSNQSRFRTKNFWKVNCFNHPDPCKPGHPALKEEGGEI